MRETNNQEVKSLQVLFSYIWWERKKKVPYAADSENKFCSFDLWNITGKNRAWKVQSWRERKWWVTWTKYSNIITRGTLAEISGLRTLDRNNNLVLAESWNHCAIALAPSLPIHLLKDWPYLELTYKSQVNIMIGGHHSQEFLSSLGREKTVGIQKTVGFKQPGQNYSEPWRKTEQNAAFLF